MSANATDNNFENDVLQSNLPVLVDFWAEWCGPCRQLSPIVDAIGADMADKLKVVKMNIDENPNTPTKFGIRGIPTLLLFKNGSLVGTKVGALPKSTLESWINETLK